MNYLSIDYGTKNIGLAYSQNGIIFTLSPIINNSQAIPNIIKLVNIHKIGKIYVGISQGRIAKLTLNFIKLLSTMIKLPVETVEEAVSTIEASAIIKNNKNSRKLVDSVSAAVILRRVINFS